ncbi:MAG: hypothetical protein IJ848_02310 [Alphaproteobacteria bacterium]|nr:hypothetical protein [Alphaproteobacteria bacterium]
MSNYKIVLVLVCFVSANSALTSNVVNNNQHNVKRENKIIIQEPTEKLMESWFNNLTEYQKFYDVNNSDLSENFYNTEYLSHIFFEIWKYKYYNEHHNNKQVNNVESVFAKYNPQFNSGYARIKFTNNGTELCSSYIDINYDFQCDTKQMVTVNNIDSTHNKNQFYNILMDFEKSGCSEFLEHDEFQILQRLFTSNYSINYMGKFDVNIDIFTYMDMCPSCWTVWNKCYNDLSKLFNNVNQINVNVFSMKPYNFLNHGFINFLKSKYSDNATTKNRMLHSIVGINEFNSNNVKIKRRNAKELKVNQELFPIKQHTDGYNIKLLIQFCNDVLTSKNHYLHNTVTKYMGIVVCMCYIADLSNKFVQAHNNVNEMSAILQEMKLTNDFNVISQGMQKLNTLCDTFGMQNNDKKCMSNLNTHVKGIANLNKKQKSSSKTEISIKKGNTIKQMNACLQGLLNNNSELISKMYLEYLRANTKVKLEKTTKDLLGELQSFSSNLLNKDNEKLFGINDVKLIKQTLENYSSMLETNLCSAFQGNESNLLNTTGKYVIVFNKSMEKLYNLIIQEIKKYIESIQPIQIEMTGMKNYIRKNRNKNRYSPQRKNSWS